MVPSRLEERLANGNKDVLVALDSTPVSSHITVEGEARKMEADANTPT